MIIFALLARAFLSQYFQIKKNPFHRKLLIFYTHINIFRRLLALLCFAAVACFTSLKWFNRIWEKKLIESQTKKLFIISRAVFSWGFFISSLDAWKKHFLSVSRLSLFRIWNVPKKNITVKTLLTSFNSKIRVFNNSAALGKAFEANYKRQPNIDRCNTRAEFSTAILMIFRKNLYHSCWI